MFQLEICSQLQGEAERKPVGFRSSIVKLLGAKWMVSLYKYVKVKPDIVDNGFKEARIVSCLNIQHNTRQLNRFIYTIAMF